MPKMIIDDIDNNRDYVSRQIYVFSIIDSWTSKDIIRQLLAMDRESNEEITMFINSRGGSIYQMFAILDTMNIVKSPIRTIVVGVAASAAACLASAGDTRLMSKMSNIMIHEASGGAFGSVSSMRDTIEQSAKLNEMMLETIAKNSGKSTQQIKDVMDKSDKYFDSNEAMAFGLVDQIMNDNDAQALKLSESINVEGYEINNVDDKEIQILRTGEYHHPIYGLIKITDEILNTMKSNFEWNVRGQDISIDYTHDNEDGESPAAFWVKSLEIRPNKDGKGNGLFARGEYTPKGAKKVSEKEYKYSSADFVIDYVAQDGKHYPYVLRGGTLTNRPFIKNMNPIKLSEAYRTQKKESVKMTKEELIAELKGHGVDVSALEANADKIRDLEAKIAELSAMPAEKEAEITALKDQLAKANVKIVEDAKASAFNDLVASGKCVPAQKEAILGVFKTAEEMTSFYKDAPVVVSLKPKGDGNEEVNGELTAEEKALVASGEYTKEEIIAGRSPKKQETTA